MRVIWSSSLLVDILAPPRGRAPAELGTPSTDQKRNYAVSKTGNWFLAAPLAKRLVPKGVVSIAENPGNLRTGIFDDTPRLIVWLSWPVLYKAVDGAHTALAPEVTVTVHDSGRYVVPWGKWHAQPREDLLEPIKERKNAGKGFARLFEECCEKATNEFW